MDTFIIVVMLCTFNLEFNQEFCTPLVQNPPVYYKTEKECEIMSRQKRKDIKQTALDHKLLVTGVYSNCIKKGKSV
jgi:hypothetical protein